MGLGAACWWDGASLRVDMNMMGCQQSTSMHESPRITHALFILSTAPLVQQPLWTRTPNCPSATPRRYGRDVRVGDTVLVANPKAGLGFATVVDAYLLPEAGVYHPLVRVRRTRRWGRGIRQGNGVPVWSHP